MAAWTGDEPEFGFAQNLSVALFYRPKLLRDALDDLAKRGYHVVEVDCDATDDQFHTRIAEALGFPPYYGRNMDALTDCLRDVAFGYYGVPVSATGLVVALWHLDAFRRARDVLDIFWFQSLCAALRGNRMLVLAQTDDPHFADTAASPSKASALVEWHQRGWLPASPR